MKYIFAPHLDDEIIGCYSILNQIDKIIYWTQDYRENNLISFPDYLINKYIPKTDFDFSAINIEDTIYLPSRFDFHPLHHKVRECGLMFDCKKMYYSVEMNVPWLEEETFPALKLDLLNEMYPDETLFNTNEKYCLFKSVKSYDYETMVSVTSKFQLEGLHSWPEAKEYFPDVAYLSNPHRHIFFIEAEKEVTHSDRDIEFVRFSREIKEYLTKKYYDSTFNLCNFNRMSCEQIGLELLERFELISCKVSEDGENFSTVKIK